MKESNHKKDNMEEKTEKKSAKTTRKITGKNYIFNYEESLTRYTMTKGEQRVLILLVFVISAALGINHFQSQNQKHSFVFQKNKSNSSDSEKIISESALMHSSEDSSGTQTLTATGAASSQKNPITKVDINKADILELATLKGIGPSRAEDIIRYRNEHGGFKTIEEIKEVSGIGQKTFEKLQAEITVSVPQQSLNTQTDTPDSKNNTSLPNPSSQIVTDNSALPRTPQSVNNQPQTGSQATENNQQNKNMTTSAPQYSHSQTQAPQQYSQPAATTQQNTSSIKSALPTGKKININKAGIEELKLLYRIGDKTAQKIINYRQQKGGFTKIEDLKNVDGIGEKIFQMNRDNITVE